MQFLKSKLFPDVHVIMYMQAESKARKSAISHPGSHIIVQPSKNTSTPLVHALFSFVGSYPA